MTTRDVSRHYPMSTRVQKESGGGQLELRQLNSGSAWAGEFSVERVEGFEFLIRLKWGPSQGSSVRVRGVRGRRRGPVSRGYGESGFEVSPSCGLRGADSDACSTDLVLILTRARCKL